MALRPRSSRARYQGYREDFAAHRTEGSSRTAAAHAKSEHSQRSFFVLFAAFWRILRGNRLTVVTALMTVTLATVLKLAPPYASKLVIDYVLIGKALPQQLVDLGVPATPSRLLVFVAFSLVVIALVSITTGMWGRWLATKTTKLIQSRLRRRVFEQASRLPLHRVYELKSGGVASILREDAGGVAELIFNMLYNPWRAVVQLAGSLTILAIIDWRLLTGAIVLLPIVYLSLRTWIARIRPLWRDIRASRQAIDGHATEAFGGMRVVRGFGRQRTETSRFITNNHVMIRQEILAWWSSRIIDIAWSVLIPIATAAMLWYGGLQVLKGVITTGDLIAFLMYLAWLLEPLAVLATSATSFQNNLAGLDRILDLLAEPREMESSPGTIHVRPASVAGRITLSGVDFTYPGTTRLVLCDVSLEVQPGERIALVGPSGSGKTTFCNLIARFYDPSQGTVELDGTDLTEIDVDSYRRLLGIVEQDIFLFDGTIAQNIGYGRRGATADDIIETARLAHAHDFIVEFDHGYDTVIGERGVKLSGGQRQRLAIARALLADPRILILDEATSNLDTENERLIQISLHTLMEGRTSFVIAHRLSTIANADRIVVLEDGRIVEQGSHDDLMQRSGRYEQMVRLQCEIDSSLRGETLEPSVEPG